MIMLSASLSEQPELIPKQSQWNNDNLQTTITTVQSERCKLICMVMIYIFNYNTTVSGTKFSALTLDSCSVAASTELLTCEAAFRKFIPLTSLY
jgi:hypothetical protein